MNNIIEHLKRLKQPIVEQCTAGEKTCSRIKKEGENLFCSVYAFPGLKWKNGNCNMADHLEIETKKDTKKVNPLKASKRGGK